jgi:hypothetical protein
MGNKKKGRPVGEVQVGVGFDEKLKRLGELFRVKGWSFTNGSGTIDADALQRMAAEQEADTRADREAWSNFQQIHEPMMKRQGERGASFSAALAFARTAARRNRDLLKLIDELKIRPATRRRADTNELPAIPS